MEDHKLSCLIIVSYVNLYGKTRNKNEKVKLVKSSIETLTFSFLFICHRNMPNLKFEEGFSFSYTTIFFRPKLKPTCGVLMHNTEVIVTKPKVNKTNKP